MNLELFSCSGGMAEGFRRAGLRFDLAIDKDPDACASYEANHGDRPLQLDANDLLKMVRHGWHAPVDLLVADPPCTPWSRAGKRKGVTDKRDCLETTCKLIGLLRPKCFLIANVPGLDDAPNWPIVQRLIGGLAKFGYCVGDFTRLDAADFGVPQHRIRPFWFGHPAGTPCITWPMRTHGRPSDTRQMTVACVGTLEPWVTCAQALGHLPIEELGRPVRLRKRKGAKQDGDLKTHPRHPPSELNSPARTVTASDGGGAKGTVLAVTDDRPISDADEPSNTVTAAARGTAVLAMRQRADGSVREHIPDAPARTVRASRSNSERMLHWPWDRPANTIQGDERMAPPGRRPAEGMSSVMSQPNAVVLSEKAAAILQGFPEGWKFVGKTKRSRWSQIGQAMPPGLAEPVARQIAAWMRGV